MGEHGRDDLNKPETTQDTAPCVFVFSQACQTCFNCLPLTSFVSSTRLEPEQVSFLIQSYMHGWKYDRKKEDLTENPESELRLPGTGHAMMQVSSLAVTYCQRPCPVCFLQGVQAKLPLPCGVCSCSLAYLAVQRC